MMEDADKDVKHKIRKLNVMMRNYLPPQLTAGTVDFHKSQMDKIRAIFEDLILSMEDMCDDFQSEMETAGRLESWKGRIPTIEKDFRDYSMRFYPILEQIKSATRSGSGSIYSSLQEEQLELLREQIEMSKRKLDATANETFRELDLRKSIAIKKVKAKKEHILSEVDVLGEEVNKVGYWEDEGNLEVSRAMRNIDVWKKKLEEIIIMKREIVEVMAENDLSEDDVEIATNSSRLRLRVQPRILLSKTI